MSVRQGDGVHEQTPTDCVDYAAGTVTALIAALHSCVCVCARARSCTCARVCVYVHVCIYLCVHVCLCVRESARACAYLTALGRNISGVQEPFEVAMVFKIKKRL